MSGMMSEEKDVTFIMRKNGIKNSIYAALACFALLVTLNVDLGSIGEEAAAGGFLTNLAVQIKSWNMFFRFLIIRMRPWLFWFLFFSCAQTKNGRCRCPDGPSGSLP